MKTEIRSSGLGWCGSNITKLAEAKRLLDKQDNVGIVLRKSQVDFVTEFLGRGKINVRQLDDEIFRTGTRRG